MMMGGCEREQTQWDVEESEELSKQHILQSTEQPTKWRWGVEHVLKNIAGAYHTTW